MYSTHSHSRSNLNENRSFQWPVNLHKGTLKYFSHTLPNGVIGWPAKDSMVIVGPSWVTVKACRNSCRDSRIDLSHHSEHHLSCKIHSHCVRDNDIALLRGRRLVR